MALIKCLDCGRDVSDSAPSCPGCGRPFGGGAIHARESLAGYAPQSKRRRSGFTGFIFLLLVMGGAGWFFLGGDRATNTTDMALNAFSEKQPIAVITAPDIVAQYESNEVAADAYYKGNIFDIVGIVTGIKKDLGDDLYVTLDGRGASRFRSVQAYFDRGMTSNLGALRKGQRLTVRCRIDGLFINVQAKGCILP